MAKKPRENRIPIMMSDEELTAVDDWRYANRVATRSDAIRRLCRIALIEDVTSPKISAAVGRIVDAGVDLAEFVESEPFSELPETKRSDLKRMADRVIPAMFDLLDEEVSRSAQMMPIKGGTDVLSDLNMATQMSELLKDKGALTYMSQTPELRERLLGAAAAARRAKERKAEPDE